MMRTRRQIAARRWLAASLTVASCAALAACYLGTQLWRVHVGLEAYDSDDFARAEVSFSEAAEALPLERWVPVFDRGAANYRAELWDAAATDFEQAAGLAPSGQQCVVRLNWAWSLEAGAQAALKAEDVMGQVTRLQQATMILSSANCPDEAPVAEDPDVPQGTLAEQQDATERRIEQAQGTATPPEDPDEGSPAEQDDQLASREAEAQAQRQEAVDQETATQPEPGEKTW